LCTWPQETLMCHDAWALLKPGKAAALPGVKWAVIQLLSMAVVGGAVCLSRVGQVYCNLRRG
jgi:hypothetical protein